MIVTGNPSILQEISDQYAPLAGEVDAVAGEFTGADREVVRRYLTLIASASERLAEQLVADADAADFLPDDDALHLWA